MDSAEVTVSSLEDRNIGEEQVPLRDKDRFVPTTALNPTVWCVFPDYKNNLLKEKARLSSPPKVIDLDRGNSYFIYLHVSRP